MGTAKAEGAVASKGKGDNKMRRHKLAAAMESVRASAVLNKALSRSGGLARHSDVGKTPVVSSKTESAARGRSAMASSVRATGGRKLCRRVSCGVSACVVSCVSCWTCCSAFGSCGSVGSWRSIAWRVA